MVLSNKKLKQKLRAIKTALLAVSEVQIHQHEGNSTNSEGPPTSTAQESLKSLLDSVAQKPRLSKREKRRKKSLPLQESAEILKNGNQGMREVESKSVLEDNKKKKKRKRGDENGLENEEVKKVTEKKKKTKKRKKNNKGKKKLENAQVKESLESGNAECIDQGLEQTAMFGESSAVCTKVYVGGIPYYSTEDDIRSYFDSCGTITEIDCMTFPESGKFRGIAIISFKTEAAAKRALALDGSDMGGLFLKIQPYKSNRVSKSSNFSPDMVEDYNKIYVGNLSWEITEDDLRNLFEGCNIASIRFGEDKETGEFRGYAHVDFSDSVSLNTALKLDQKIVCGRPARISCAVPRKGSANKTQTPAQNETVSKTEPPPEIKTAGGDGVTAVSGKIRRRTCYECGERGHLSSFCPKKQEAGETNLNAS